MSGAYKSEEPKSDPFAAVRWCIEYVTKSPVPSYIVEGRVETIEQARAEIKAAEEQEAKWRELIRVATLVRDDLSRIGISYPLNDHYHELSAAIAAIKGESQP